MVMTPSLLCHSCLCPCEDQNRQGQGRNDAGGSKSRAKQTKASEQKAGRQAVCLCENREFWFCSGCVLFFSDVLCVVGGTQSRTIHELWFGETRRTKPTGTKQKIRDVHRSADGSMQVPSKQFSSKPRCNHHPRNFVPLGLVEPKRIALSIHIHVYYQ